ILGECPVAELGRDEPDQPANANVRHLVALDTCVDPGTRHFQEARSFTCIPQWVPQLLCCVHGAPNSTSARESSQHRYDSFLYRDVSLEEEVHHVLAEVLCLAAPPVAVQGVNHRRWKPIPGARVLDEIVDDFVERLPPRFLHP